MAAYVLVSIRQGARDCDVVGQLEWDDDGPFAVLPQDRDASLPGMIRLYQNKLTRLDAPGSDAGLPPKYHHPGTVQVPERH
jgi:hypothetical protein